MKVYLFLLEQKTNNNRELLVSFKRNIEWQDKKTILSIEAKAFHISGTPLSIYKGGEMTYKEELKNSDRINDLLARYGVKFGIYKNGEFIEQLFPFDPIARIIKKRV